MNPKILFRSLLVSSLVCHLLSMIAGILLQTTLPPELQHYLQAQDAAFGSMGGIQLFAAVSLTLVLLVVLIISIVGVWRFRNWGRKLWIFLAVAGIVITPFIGESVANAWESMFAQIAITLDGGVLAMMFIEPINSLFEASKKTQAGHVQS
ncbi:MAG: hypothetical protein LBC18_02965 [Opitutaceae bacterium]|jgi:hypothetical protein|nr:hypothetical protein [Opitutaceae bacterium]